MKLQRIAFVPVLALAVSACATAPSTGDGAEPDLASKYIHAVERAASQRATTVLWLNPPSNEQVAERLGRDSEN
ncbi:MAG: hypothetical protein P8008_00745 [Gammaproteobacteria bacterium]